MASLNKVFIMGNLTRDPELRYTPAGVAVSNLGVATNRRYKDKSGELKEEVCFLTVVAWDKQAEVCNQYLHKGSPIFVEGRLQSRSWDGPDGKKRTVIEVRAERVQFLGSPGGKGSASADSSFPPADKTNVVKSQVVDNSAFSPGSDEVSWGQDVVEDTN